MEEILTAVNAALYAGKHILDIYETKDFDVESKDDNSPLTRADKKSHDVILQYLKPLQYPVLSEEGKEMAYEERSDWYKFWCVDPLDGTKEFIKRNGEFTVNIAMIEDQKAVSGIIYVPATGELYVGINGLGAWKFANISPDTKIESLEALLEKGTKLPFTQGINKPFMIVGSRSHMNDETREVMKTYEHKFGETEVVSRGSSLKLCMVAEGKADLYPRFAPTMEWDTAAGHDIAQAAGMLVTTTDLETPLLYNKKDLQNPWFIVRKKGV